MRDVWARYTALMAAIATALLWVGVASFLGWFFGVLFTYYNCVGGLH